MLGIIQKKNILIFIFCVCFSASCYALPFSIVPRPGFPLPTELLSGGFATAYYTVTNNTQSVRSGNFVRYLPPNVTQVVVDNATPNLCGAVFTLQPNGTSGDSCILELRITGPVSSAGCDPKTHLMVCLAGGLICAGTSFPLNVAEVNLLLPNMLTVGNFSLSTPLRFADGAQPALIVNSTSAFSWTYVTPINPPGIFTSANFYSVSCANSTCATVGQYTLGLGFQPAIIVSNNKGIAWRYVFPANSPGTITNANLSSVVCVENNHCAAVGNYTLAGGTQMSLLASGDSGQTWQFITPSNSPGVTLAANLNTVICPADRCIAVGQYNTGGGFQPAVIVSEDQGISWGFITPADAPGLPLTSIALSTVDCAGNSCAIVGQYNTGSGTQPAIIVSPNGGAWHYVTPGNSPGTIRSTTLRSVRCVNSLCAAVGQYTISLSGPELPAIIVSTNNAATWQFITPSNSPGTLTDALLTAVDCSGAICAAVGRYDIGQGSQPAIVVSTDTGVTWRYVSPSNSPGTITSAILNAVFCRGNLCIAAGQYDIGAGTQPAVITSLDGGVSWQFANPSNSPGTITASNLLSVECKGTTCAAVGQYNTGAGTRPLIIASGNSGATWQFIDPANLPGNITSGILNKVAGLLS